MAALRAATLLAVVAVCCAEKDTVVSLVGATVRLACRIDRSVCGEMHSIKWYKGDTRLYVFSEAASPNSSSVNRKEGDMSSRLSVEYAPTSATAALAISSVHADDEGTYRCEITYLQVGEHCDTVQLIQLDTHILPEEVELKDSSERNLHNGSHLGPLDEGAKTTVSCSVKGGKPVPEITWLKNGKEISGSISTSNGVRTNVLSLTASRDLLGAALQCRVSSAALAQPILSDIHLEINMPPSSVAISGVKHHVTEGTTITLECSATGAKPPANVTWYVGTDAADGEVVTHYEKDSTYETLSKLIFVATREDNAKQFRCEAENQVSRQKKLRPLEDTLTLEVLYPPVPKVSPSNITVKEGANILLFCSYDANPSTLLNVTWYKGDDSKEEEVNVKSAGGHYEGGTPDQPNLLIRHSNGDDSGSYRCSLTNSVGNGSSDTAATVVVQFVPTVSLTMSTRGAPVLQNQHHNVTLSCDVLAGHPETLTEVTWYLDGEVLKRLPECDTTSTTTERNQDQEAGYQELCYDVDPSMLLLQNTSASFHGNYSCEGKNEAGWGPRSEDVPLVVYYPPGPAKLTYSPHQVIKGRPVKLKCSVEEKGRPETNRFQWYRGAHLVKDVDSDEWSKKLVGLDIRDNISCRAVNEAGAGPPASVFIQVLVAPNFKYSMMPYTGALYKAENISLSCAVEANPLVGVQWLRNNTVIDERDGFYRIEQSILPADPQKNDFQATLSILHWNMSAWRDQRLDPRIDNADYACRSSDNTAGPGVISITNFAVEYEPANITVMPTEVSVKEGEIPDKVVCLAQGNPSPKYSWRRSDGRPFGNSSAVIRGGTLLLAAGVQRRDSGDVACEAANKHGAVRTEFYLNVLYKPECAIQQVTLDGFPTLVCTPNANPNNVSFEWRVKSENDSLTDELIWQREQQSFLRLSSDVELYRTYQCRATNAVGQSNPCEIDVTADVDHLSNKLWYKDQQKLILIGSIALAVLIITIVLCIIIICICRRMRSKSKCPPTNGGDSGANGPLGTDNPGLYENLPFHGLQQAPNKNTNLLQQQYLQKRSLVQLGTKGKSKKSAQNSLQKNNSFCYFEPIRTGKRDYQGPLIYQTNESKTLDRRDKNFEMNRLKKSESLREKLSCVGAYDYGIDPSHFEDHTDQKNSYLQYLKTTSASSRNINNPIFNTTGPKEERKKRLLYADLDLGNHNMKFKNTLNRQMLGTYSITNDTNYLHTNQRRTSSQSRPEYATLKFNEIDV